MRLPSKPYVRRTYAAATKHKQNNKFRPQKEASDKKILELRRGAAIKQGNWAGRRRKKNERVSESSEVLHQSAASPPPFFLSFWLSRLGNAVRWLADPDAEQRRGEAELAEAAAATAAAAAAWDRNKILFEIRGTFEEKK